MGLVYSIYVVPAWISAIPAGQDKWKGCVTHEATKNRFVCYGRIKIGGSSSVYGLMQELAEVYMKINSHAAVEVVETDSTNGLTGAMSGTYDIGMSSRELKDYEKQLLEYEVIAKDEIAVIVHSDNPLENISSEDLRNVYTGEITEWKELQKQ